MCAAMVSALQDQCLRFPGRVEVLVETDRGELSIGAKRQKLLERATGEYVAFVDDDDKVSKRYIRLILDAIRSKPDVVGITGTLFVNGRQKKPFHHTTSCTEWYETAEAYFRCPNHLNPVRREHALAIGFADMNHGEDRDYSFRLQASGLLKSEATVVGSIYNYLYCPKTSASRKK